MYVLNWSVSNVRGFAKKTDVSIHSLVFLTLKIALSDVSLPLLLSLGFHAVKISLSAVFRRAIS